LRRRKDGNGAGEKGKERASTQGKTEQSTPARGLAGVVSVVTYLLYLQ